MLDVRKKRPSVGLAYGSAWTLIFKASGIDLSNERREELTFHAQIDDLTIKQMGRRGENPQGQDEEQEQEEEAQGDQAPPPPPQEFTMADIMQGIQDLRHHVTKSVDSIHRRLDFQDEEIGTLYELLGHPRPSRRSDDDDDDDDA